jgi:hypothetical protein
MPAAKPRQGVALAIWWPFTSPIPPEEHQGVHQLLILRQRRALSERLPLDDLSVVVLQHA